MGRVHMTDSPDITGNIINAGFKDTSLMHSVTKATGDVTHALGFSKFKTEQKAIVLQGKREDYTFEFNNDTSPAYGNYTGSVDITHVPTGAKNKYMNFNYVAFEGEATNFVELPKLKAEQAAKTAVGKTRGQIAPVPESVASQSSAVNGEASQNSLQTMEALSERITECMKKGQTLEEVLGTLDKEYPGALQSMEHAKPGENVTPKAIAQRIVQECVQGRS